MDETSLDDFVTESEEAAAPEDGADGAGAAEEGAEEEESAAVEGAAEATGDDAESRPEPVTTMGSVPDGTACPNCDRTVRRLWTDDGTAVCRACKEW